MTIVDSRLAASTLQCISQRQRGRRQQIVNLFNRANGQFTLQNAADVGLRFGRQIG